MKCFKTLFISTALSALMACSSGHSPSGSHSINYRGSLDDPIMTIALLSEQQYEWAGTPYQLGGQSRSGIDCSGFVQKTLFDRFGVTVPRTTKEQANYGHKISKSDMQTGDLVFFKTGRGPNGYHVGIYWKDDLFIHASTKGGVIYSSLNSPYWRKAYWQTRRI